jgi:hypothetical protein
LPWSPQPDSKRVPRAAAATTVPSPFGARPSGWCADELLAIQPLMGRARDELPPGLRSFPFGRHVIFFEPIEDGIEVVRPLHSARDADAQFEGSGA